MLIILSAAAEAAVVLSMRRVLCVHCIGISCGARGTPATQTEIGPTTLFRVLGFWDLGFVE